MGAIFVWALFVAERLLLQSTEGVLGLAVLLLGLSGGAFVAASTFVTLLVLDWPFPGKPNLGHRDLPAWLLRLQQVNLRTKIVVPTVVLAVVPTGAIGVLVVPFVESTLRDRLVDQLEFQTTSSAFALESFLQDLHRDLRVVSDLPTLVEMADPGSATRHDPAARRILERELMVFAQGRDGYAQLRLLDSDAHEVIRLAAVPGESRLEAVSSLRQDADPHYLEAAQGMESDRIYVSQLDVIPGLDGQGGTVLSCATPIDSEGDAGRGLLVVDVNPMEMVSMLGPMPEGVEVWLVDQDDFYIAYVGSSDEKRARYAMSRRRSLSRDFGADELAAIQNGNGVRTVELGTTILTAASITADPELPLQQWKLLIAHPLESVSRPTRRLSTALWAALAILLSVASGSGVLIAHYVSRPLSLLRQATVEIAAGNLSKEVSVTTGDEIEGLARDFNRMTRRLRKAQERLARWNLTLKEQVDQRTESLQQLQAGLAKADKLATVGQMTASVMHEIGNPLAAIKTKIQVAEEGSDLAPGARDVLDSVLTEVDRLASVLRSYSRLGRLGSTSSQPVSLADTVRGVIALVGPELRRQGVALDVVAPEELPMIQGEADRLRQLLINLLLNAAEASEGGGQVTIRLECTHEADAPDPAAVRIEIEDRGTGISDENLRMIWNPLFTTKPDGTGLGLPICKEIVEDHGGSVEIRSAVGEGTVVTLTFPVLPNGTNAE